VFVEIDPSEMLASEEGTSSQNATAENPGNTGATETRFDAMKSVATADPQVELPADWAYSRVYTEVPVDPFETGVE
jgi:hypothetical protein